MAVFDMFKRSTDEAPEAPLDGASAASVKVTGPPSRTVSSIAALPGLRLLSDRPAGLSGFYRLVEFETAG